jgi:hypothetical protein
MAIDVDSCAAQETIVVTTRSSVYELVVLRGDRGDVFVRGGRHFTEVTRVLFLGSMADDGSLELHTIGIGLRMKFVCGARVVITSPVQSLSCRSADRERRHLGADRTLSCSLRDRRSGRAHDV